MVGVGAGDGELEAAAARALHGYLATEGFSDPVLPRTGGLVFQRNDTMLRFLRRPREAEHDFDVQVSIGQRRSADIVDWVRIPKLTSDGSMAHALWVWELPDAPDLTAALERLRDEVLEPHVAPFWRDPSRLEPVFDAQERELENRLRAGVEQQNLQAARESFQHGRFREAEQYFDRLDRLSHSDQKRRDIAHDAVRRGAADDPDGAEPDGAGTDPADG